MAVILLAIVAMGATSTLVYLSITNIQDERNHVYMVDLDRTSEDEEGLEMIGKAEKLELVTILNLSPRDEGLIPMFKPAEGRANFISSDNLEYYSNHIQELEGSHTFGHYTMEYSAVSIHASVAKLRFRSMNDRDQTASGLYFNGRRVAFWGGVMSNLLFNNGTSLEKVNVYNVNNYDETLEIEYRNCYVIEMKLDYSAKPKPDEGGGFEMHQYVILDSEGGLQFFYNSRVDTGSLEEWLGAPW